MEIERKREQKRDRERVRERGERERKRGERPRARWREGERMSNKIDRNKQDFYKKNRTISLIRFRKKTA